MTQDNKPGDTMNGTDSVIRENTNIEGLHWIVSYNGLDPSINNAFYFRVFNDEYSFSSHYIYIVGENVAPSSASINISKSTSMLPSSIIVPSATSLTSSSLSSSAGSTTSSHTTASASPGQIAITESTGMSKKTMAVVIALSIVGAGLFLSLGAVVVCRYAKRRRAHKNITGTGVLADASSSNDAQGSDDSPASMSRLHELQGDPRAEAEGDRTIWDHQPHYWRHEISAVSPAVRTPRPS
ncbi:hypothetical protein F5Y06DRAFT_299715 [Hypoxylon sp. FL0890]|nr:hypothetical protein F5Y06DRAFT_299715 [Hypoxylon sp. FL0890]